MRPQFSLSAKVRVTFPATEAAEYNLLYACSGVHRSLICHDGSVAATIWRGRITFGMVSLPVRLYKAARRERIKFHHVYRSPNEPEELRSTAEEPPPFVPEDRAAQGRFREFSTNTSAVAPVEEIESVARVRHAPLDQTMEEQVPQRSILKGFEAQKGQYVVFDPKEISALRPNTSTELELLEFVRLDEIDPIFFDASYYLAPDKGGEKPYALLFQAMQKAGYIALGSLAMHGREHAIVIRPGSRGLILHTLFYANEVRSEEEWQADTQTVTGKELELAGLLVKAMEARFAPEKLKDTLEERLRELIESRAPIATTAGTPSASRKAPVVDIMEALRRSLEAKRKPVAKEGHDRKVPPSGQKRRRAAGDTARS